MFNNELYIGVTNMLRVVDGMTAEDKKEKIVNGAIHTSDGLFVVQMIHRCVIGDKITVTFYPTFGKPYTASDSAMHRFNFEAIMYVCMKARFESSMVNGI
jgi:hypothetical protein